MKKKYNKKMLRYGENPNQSAYIIHQNKESIFDNQISGKKISYNNILDLDSGIRCISEFNEPTSIIMKHTNPCGVASSRNIKEAFKKSYESDSKSAFGGIILNRKVKLELAKSMVKNFFEMIVAPDFTIDSINILKTKKNLILIKSPKIVKLTKDYKSTLFGDLYQSEI